MCAQSFRRVQSVRSYGLYPDHRDSINIDQYIRKLIDSELVMLGQIIKDELDNGASIFFQNCII